MFVQPKNFLIAPIFEYGQTQSNALTSISSDGNYGEYGKIKENEFFMMSEKIINQMYELKSQLISQYSLEEGANDD